VKFNASGRFVSAQPRPRIRGAGMLVIESTLCHLRVIEQVRLGSCWLPAADALGASHPKKTVGARRIRNAPGAGESLFFPKQVRYVSPPSERTGIVVSTTDAHPKAAGHGLQRMDPAAWTSWGSILHFFTRALTRSHIGEPTASSFLNFRIFLTRVPFKAFCHAQRLYAARLDTHSLAAQTNYFCAECASDNRGRSF